ncbi:MAG TPA: glycosyltransferase family 1 protein [Hyphomicrobiales bacterium]|nr:glycosyltransferase family 1 protein [Hyphomicrobiales bacterium]
MRIFIATDAWTPQVNGVVQTYQRLNDALLKLGHDVGVMTPNGYHSVAMPTYSEIRLAFVRAREARRKIDAFEPDHIHVATEGPIGLAARRVCLRQDIPFTTSYHTKFPEYISARLPVPLSLGYSYERWFHNAGSGTMVATASLMEELKVQRMENLMPWSRGVNTELFRPRSDRLFGKEPVFLYVGRVSVEKNLEAFLRLDLPGRKVIVGGGPRLKMLKSNFPDTIFTGPLFGEELAKAFASADVFVFPSLTDTYGVVLLEALACGVPVAAFPVTGPRDVIVDCKVGSLKDDLREAALTALEIDRNECRSYALGFSWERCALQFIDNIGSVTFAEAA